MSRKPQPVRFTCLMILLKPSDTLVAARQWPHGRPATKIARGQSSRLRSRGLSLPRRP